MWGDKRTETVPNYLFTSRLS